MKPCVKVEYKVLKYKQDSKNITVPRGILVLTKIFLAKNAKNVAYKTRNKAKL